MEVSIKKVRNHDHIVGEEFKEVYSEDELAHAKKEIQSIVDEYEGDLNANGHELGDDQDKVNDVYAVTESLEGDYDFDCGDFTYHISIEA